MKQISRIIVSALALMIALLSSVSINVRAEGVSLSEYEHAHSINPVTETEVLTLKGENAKSDTVPRGSDALEAADIEFGKTYTVVYENALNYYDKWLTVTVDMMVEDYTPEHSDFFARVRLGKTLTAAHWSYAPGLVTDWKISFTDEDGKPYKVTLLLGLDDPDESDYLFNTSGREFYYKDGDISKPDLDIDAPASAAVGYHVRNNGLFLEGADINFHGFDNAMFFIGLENESEFSFQTSTFNSGMVAVPSFRSLKRKWKVTYDLKDNEANPATNPNIDLEAPNDPEKSFIEYSSGVGFEKEIKNPSRDGYRFMGWTREDIDDPESEDNYKIQKWDVGDKRFIASWEALPQNYKVEYYYMDEAGKYPETPTSEDLRESVTDATVTVTDVDKTPDSEMEGYEGYVLDENAEGKVYEAVVKADGTTVLKVYFKKAYTVIYDSGEHSQDENVVNDGLDYGVDTPKEATFTPDAGYEFDGWDVEIAPTVTENATYVAQWKPIIYPVKYVLNDDETHPAYNPSDNPSEYTIEDEYDILEPTRNGYKFLGWEEGNRIEVGSTGEKVFTAKWEKIIYPVEYVMNGGDNHPDNPTEYTIDDYYKIKNPARAGYNFVGWAEGDEIPVGSTGKKVFTAIWEKIAKPAPIVVPSTGVDYR